MKLSSNKYNTSLGTYNKIMSLCYIYKPRSKRCIKKYNNILELHHDVFYIISLG